MRERPSVVLGVVCIVTEVREAPLHDMQALLLLANAHVDLSSSVKSAIVQEGQKFLEVLNNFIIICDRSNEFVVTLYFDHQGGQFQIQQQNVLLVLHGSQHLVR